MSVWRYRFAGLLIESSLHIPEWDVFSSGDGRAEPDVEVILARGTEESGVSPSAREAHRFSVPGVAGFSITDGRCITVQPAPDADIDNVRVYMLGTALAALCAQRGLLFLHSSVVRLGSRAVALCGPSGAGKSTLAAALVDRGGSFVSDDVARFDTHAGGAIVYPSTPRLKLTVEALQCLGWSSALDRVHRRAVKFHVPQIHADAWSPVPLETICILEWTEGPARLEALTGLQALRGLVSAGTYRTGVFESRERQAAHWRQCAAITSCAAVFSLQRPRRWHTVRDATNLLGGLLDRPR